MLGAVFFPVAYVGVGLIRNWPVTQSQWPLLAFAIVIPAMIVYKHRGNIARLRAGTESRFARRS
jgi:glycerol-3-phosphate acyltransferase PlsY